MERLYAHRRQTLEQKGCGEGASADLISKVGLGFLHPNLPERSNQIGVAQSLPKHLRSKNALCVSGPINHGVILHETNIIESDANPVDLLGLDHHIRCERIALEDESQHFLLSARARTLDLKRVARMSEEEAEDAIVAIRYAETDGEPFCHHCKCAVVYRITRNLFNRKTGAKRQRRLFKCANCLKQFSPTSGTIFASRKLAFRDILFAIALYTNGAKGKAALHLSRDLNVQYKTAFVLEQKLREALGTLQHAEKLAGSIEVDGAYYGGYVKPSTRKENRRDRRTLANQTGKRRCVTVVRERNGKTRAFVRSELETAKLLPEIVEPGSIIYADEAKAYDSLHAIFDMRRIDHSKSYAEGEISTNHAESFHSRMRRAEQGVHHHLSGYTQAYSDEMTWREDNRRLSNGEQFLTIVAAGLHHPVSRQWKGYWQRRAA